MKDGNKDKCSMSMFCLDDVAESIVDGPFGSNLKVSDYIESGVPVLQGKNITGNSFVWRDVRYISKQKAGQLKRSSAVAGDHLLIKIGSIGYSAILDDLKGYDFAIIPANLARIRPNRKIVDGRYLHRVLTSDSVSNHLNKVASKTAQPALSLAKIKATQIPIPLKKDGTPDLDEQKRIASILDAADALRQKRREALAKLDTFLEATFLDMFGDPVTNPKGWEVKKLGDLCDPLRGISYGVVQRGEHCSNGIPLIRIKDIVNGEVASEDLIRCDKALTEKYKRTKLEGGELVISIRGTVGRIASVPDSLRGGNITRELALIPLNKSVNSMFVLELLRTRPIFNRLADDVKGVAQKGINLEDLRMLNVVMPSTHLVEDFEEICRSMYSRRIELINQFSAIELLFSSIQLRAFSGEL